ncbi:anaerobic sulfatase maturase [Halanaerobium hydrogeniformans]|uniref:Radical SAM domain protein n=1 Tax=Halanaerobium hydrogeniformans TaxID=656519 RepID=E4RNB0_HALHG|nr:anaerobic sulfatase maturase [Halanaerobium hydrogeniformans]ADQ13578.1 Radical SAM domain protein [Halanaerobium hydrogeniformans]
MTDQKTNFNVMAFPAGAVCNLDCEYCYYLKKTELYPQTNDFQMKEETLEEYIKQYIKSQPGPVINFGWQGGEPILRGLDFFKKAVELQQKYVSAGWRIENSIQTNAVLIDEQWAQFLQENNFLVGVSLDGTAELHDRYRKDKKGKGSHQKVMAGIEKLKEYGVTYNILAVVNDVNAKKPKEVYQFFKENEVDFIQFIPIVEQDSEGNLIYRSVGSKEYGKFLIGIFNEWIDDLGDIYVQIFEEALSAWAGYGANLCVFTEECGKASVIEHNGDLYSCDHFVEPEYKLGNIKEKDILEMMNSSQQQDFGRAKKEKLNKKCLGCDYLFFCNGGCPKNRIVDTDADYKLNYLCEGYKLFFDYIDPFMKRLAQLVKQRKSPPVMKKEMQKLYQEKWNVGRNDPCPCGSGKKYKKCCL